MKIKGISYRRDWVWPLVLTFICSCSSNDTNFDSSQVRINSSTPTPTPTPVGTSSPVTVVTIGSATKTPTTMPTVEVSVSATSPTPTPSPVLGKNSTYIGFGSATGKATNEHWIHDFSWTSRFNNINFNNFIKNLSLVGTAAVIADKLRLTETKLWESGNAYLKDPVFFIDSKDMLIDWSAYFAFSIGGGTGGDGISFIIQSQSSDAGGGGVGIGYQGISTSIAVVFDTIKNDKDESGNPVDDPNNNHIEIDVNGSVKSLATYTPPVAFCGVSGQSDLRYSWIDYSAGLLKVYFSASNSKPNLPNMTHELNLKNYLVH